MSTSVATPRAATRTLLGRALMALAVVLPIAQTGDGLALQIFLANRSRVPNLFLASEPGERVSCEGCPVVLISADTLRPDHLGTYGYELDTSPAVDELAAEGVTFRTAIAHGPSTLISHSSAFTSLIPAHHGASIRRRRALAPEALTLAEVLSARGYATAAFTGGAQLDAKWGVDQGFDQYVSTRSRRRPGSELEDDEDPGGGASMADIAELADEFLDETGDRPFFLFLHTYEIHAPYEPAPRYRVMFETQYHGDLPVDMIRVQTLRDINNGVVEMNRADLRHITSLYDAGIREFDEGFAKVMRVLREHGAYDRALIILMSDHGEALGDHGGLSHNRSFFEDQIRVALIMKLPGAAYAGAQPEGMVRLIDLMPTTLDALGVPPVPGMYGASLLDVIHGDRSAILSAVLDKEAPRARGAHGIRTNRWKLFENRLYDLVADPGERRNVGRKFGTVRDALRLELSEILAERPSLDATEAEMDDELREQLRALGYIE